VLVFHYGWYFPELLESVGPEARHVYECLDEHTRAPNIAGKQWAEDYVTCVERRLLDRAELVVYSNPDLALKRKAKKSEVVMLGVEAEHFSRPARGDPHEALRIGRPRIGFLGVVTPRENWEMVRSAARAAPDWQWVVLGPQKGVRPDGPGNLHWIGAVDYAEVPDWTQHWDAGMVPLALSDFNLGSWPLKFYEYLASGLPVVSTPIPAAARIAEEAPGLISIAPDESSEGFIRAARAALAASSTELRRAARAIAGRHTWESRAQRILASLSGALS
jgi:glycosyltransferase involved in cell wall biosynthesis